MKLNTNKTKALKVSRSRTMHLVTPFPACWHLADGVTESDELEMLGVTFDTMMAFE